MSNVSPPEFVRTLLTKFLEPPMDADKIKSNIKPPINAHPSSLTLLPRGEGKLEPPLSFWERGGGEGRTRIRSKAKNE